MAINAHDSSAVSIKSTTDLFVSNNLLIVSKLLPISGYNSIKSYVMFDFIENLLFDFGKKPEVICSQVIFPFVNNSVTSCLLKLMFPSSI